MYTALITITAQATAVATVAPAIAIIAQPVMVVVLATNLQATAAQALGLVKIKKASF